MSKNLAIIFCFLIFGGKVLAQQTTASPYSYFGIGQVLFNGTEDVKAMGGLGIKGDSIALNLNNPASYSHLKLTNFSVGGTSTFMNLKTDAADDSAKRTNLDYVALGIPMGKLGGAFGLMPYSATGYKMQSTSTNNQGYEREQSFNGTGNLNRAFVGLSYQITPKLSAGANLEYNFGKYENQISEYITGVYSGTREINKSVVRGVSTNFGLMYTDKLNETLEMYSSFTYAPKATLGSDNTRTLSTVIKASSGVEYTIENRNLEVADTDLIIPSKFSGGLGIGKKNKWMFGAEVTLSQNKDMTNRLSDDNSNSHKYNYENGQKYSIGGFYIPKYNSFSNIFNRSVYRAGFRYAKTGLVINDESINDYGINFGVGVPLGISKIDLGFEVGKRGTTNNNLIQENYFNISIGLSLSDKWFKKVYID